MYFGPCHRGSESLGLRAHSHEKYTEMTREWATNHESRGEKKADKDSPRTGPKIDTSPSTHVDTWSRHAVFTPSWLDAATRARAPPNPLPRARRAQQVSRTGQAPFRLQKSSKEAALPCKVHRSRAKIQCTHLSEASKVKPCPGHCCTLHLPPLLLPEWPRGQGPEVATSRLRRNPATHVELANAMLEPCGVVGSSIQRRFGEGAWQQNKEASPIRSLWRLYFLRSPISRRILRS